MFFKWLNAIVLVLLIVCPASSIHAQTLSSAKTKLAGYEQQLATLNDKQTELKNSIANNEAELSQLNRSSSPEQEQLNAAEAALNAATAAYEANPSPENKSKMSNIRFKHALAERKYKKANAVLFKLTEETDALKAALTNTQKEIASTQGLINQQRALINQLNSKRLAEEQALRDRQQKLLEQQKLEAQKAQQEIARLKALLEKEKQSAPPAATAKPATPSPQPAAPAAKSQPAVQPTEQTIAVTKPAAVEAQQAEQKKTGAILLSSQTEINTEEQRIKTLLAKPDGNRQKYNRILNLKPADGNGKINTISLRPLGHEQYRGKGALPSGDIIFVVGFYRWRQNIENADDYQFILDLSDTKNPRLLYFAASSN